MCDRCWEYDDKIARLRRLAREVADDLFARTAETMVSELLAERAKLRCEESDQAK